MAMHKSFFRLNIIARLSLGLIALTISLLMIADILFGIFSSPQSDQEKVRASYAHGLSLQIISLIETNNLEALNLAVQHIKESKPDIDSIGVRKANGQLVASSRNHFSYWKLPVNESLAENYLSIPLSGQYQQWGNIEISYKPQQSNSIWDALKNNRYLLYISITLFSFMLTYAYLSRALHFLNPSHAVPNRVNNAFDIINDGIIVLNDENRVILANAAFFQMGDFETDDLHGKKAHELTIVNDLIKQMDKGDTPWKAAFSDFSFTSTLQGNDSSLALLASSTPINDDNSNTRGFLLTFKNMNELHAANQRLQDTLQKLKLSRAKLKVNNEQLEEMAYKDPLTGCLNRRAFFQQAEDLFALANQGNTELYCIMADIDFFKSFNDIYGHYVGDLVIQATAKIFTSCLRTTDLIGRYGGEEFCILIRDTRREEALAIAERMRKTLEDTANKSLPNNKVKQITASFGVASIQSGPNSLETFIDYADNALYMSKESGRNKVTQWTASDIK